MAGSLERVALITDRSSRPATGRGVPVYHRRGDPKVELAVVEQARLSRYLRHAQPRIFVAPANFGVPLLT